MDALPIHEENDHPFISKVEGVMHACGHDAHTAMLVGAGWLLNDIREELPGRVLLLFQPAEENSPTGGAKRMMKEGVFREQRPDVIFAQHVIFPICARRWTRPPRRRLRRRDAGRK
jgi:metal-dependent amidase/aminoacylase/carboxypeptidase family protein